MSEHKKRLRFRWAASLPGEQWAIYRQAIEAIHQAGVPLLLGGGFALATFTGRWRNTKDIDFYIHPQDHKRVIAALDRAGFEDYFKRQPYDRSWSYRGVKAEVIADFLWGMANHRAEVDEGWFERACWVRIKDQELRVIPPEQLLWCKLYILQRSRCDWTDLFNLLYARGEAMDWEHLLRCLDEDAPLLQALLTAYGWLCPRSARKLPRSLWRRLKMSPPHPGAPKRDRIRLLDSRDWFAGRVLRSKPLEV